ncbi:MAG TPA: recombinase family protein [Candidatus Faecousia intestinigallinarum]|nr:recombinase family protein [Candidatus Faecousia intestinigallinarum]
MGKKLKACAYCRVSSNSADQLNSYAVQVRYYTKAIQSRADWELVDIFADEGITGTRTDKRTEFQRMIQLCNHKQIDLIITKSVSRFARNVPECLEYARSLRRQGIGIIFEENGINTLRMSDELMLSTFSAIAQEESIAISQRLKHLNRERMKRGEYVAGTAPYGYRYQDKRLAVFEPEAETVRWIFAAYLSGWSLAEIVRDLRQRHIPKRNSDDKWHTLTVQYILTNEKYIGDTLFQKTFKSDTLPFTKHKNNGELDQYYASESHEAIISREDFLAVASLMAEKSEYYGRQRPNTPYPLTKKIRCSRCGAFYIRRTGKDHTVWSCHNHIRGKDLCDSRRYREAQIYGAFMIMFNKLYYNSRCILRNTLYQLDFVMTYKKKNNQQAVELNQSIVQLLEKKHMIEQLRSKDYLPDSLFLSQCRDIDKQLQALRTEKEILFDTRLEATYGEIKRLTAIVEDYGQEMTSFDEDIFDAIVKSITITTDGIIEFTLMGDLHFSERL